MKKTFKMLVISIVGMLSLSGSLNADCLTKEDAKKIVEPFYKFLSGANNEKEVRKVISYKWKSFSANQNDAYKGLEDNLKFLGGPIRTMIPNLKWEIKDIMVANCNTIIVRGEATGTPAGDNFMGTSIKGKKSFKIMSIDMHEVENKKIVKSYHIEDWFSAINQVR